MKGTAMECPACHKDTSASLTFCERCGAPLPLDQGETEALTHWSEPAASASHQPEIAVGSRIGGRYEVIRMLGRGGMGAVCLAHDSELDRNVAIKIIRGDLAGRAGVLERFKRELLIAQRVTHPNVVRIYDLGVAGPLRFITMEYIEGEDLRDVTKKRGRLAPRDAAGITVQVCRGLAAAHAAGIVHRDLKPANIMIDASGRVAVMDFGVARSMANTADEPALPRGHGSSPDLTAMQGLVGTPIYMSPEQARGQPVDHRSDLFSVGIILFQLISGSVPAAGPTAKETLKNRRVGRCTPLIEVEPSTPPGLNAIVMRCLEPEPGKRYQSAEEVANALEAWLRGEQAPAAAKTERSRLGKWAGIAAVAALAGSAGIYTWTNRTPKVAAPHEPVRVLIADFANTTGNPVLDGALEPMLALNLEGAPFITLYNRSQAHRLALQMSGAAALDLKAAQLVAQREGVNLIVTGAVSGDRTRYKLTLTAIDAANGQSLAEHSSSVSSTENMVRAVAESAAQLRNKLGDRTPVATQVAAAETFTSKSLEASRAYSDAQDLQWKGKLDEALAAYRSAVEKDPDLGRAYSGMAVTLTNLNRRKEAEEMYRLAMSKIDRMSDREKYRTRGAYYLFRKDYEKAAEEFQGLVKAYPADTAGLGNLALAYLYHRDTAAAVEVGRKAVAIYPGNILQSNNLGLYEMYAGDFEAALRDFNRVLAVNATYERAFIGIGLSQLALDRESEAEAAYGKLAALSARGASISALAMADLALYEGRAKDAIGILEAAIRADGSARDSARVARKWIALGEAWLESGNRSAAADAASKAVAASEEDSVLYAGAMVMLGAGQEARALAYQGQLSARLGPVPDVLSKLIQAEVKQRRREFREAISIYQAAAKVSDTWLGRYGRGRAYLGAGAFTEADAEFDLCLKRRGEATAVFLDEEPSYRYVAGLYYEKARAQEGLSSTSGARASYQTFLKIQAKADPGSARVEDARKRLAALPR